MTDDLALSLAATTIQHFTAQLEAVDQAIAETIDNDVELSAKRDLLVSINGVGKALAGIVLAELPGPDILGSSAAVAGYAGLNPQQHQSGISVNRPVRISKIGNAVLRTALYMPALSAMRYNPAVVALVDRLKAQGRLKGKQIVIAAMRKLLVLCFGEADFLDCSYGFRPGRNPHHALQALRLQIVTRKVSHVFEADIRSYFTRINHQWIRKMVAHRNR